MLIQDRFVSTTELQQNVARTIDKAKNEDIIVIRNNKLEAAIISIEKYNQLQEYLEWKKLSQALENMETEEISKEKSQSLMNMNLLEKDRRGKRYNREDIEKVAEDEGKYEKFKP